MATSPDSRLSDTGVFINFQSLRQHQTIAQQTLNTTSIQAEPDPDAIPQAFEALPRVSINIPKGLKEYIKAELLNT